MCLEGVHLWSLDTLAPQSCAQDSHNRAEGPRYLDRAAPALACIIFMPRVSMGNTRRRDHPQLDALAHAPAMLTLTRDAQMGDMHAIHCPHLQVILHSSTTTI